MRLAKTAVEKICAREDNGHDRHRNPQRQLVAVAPCVPAPIDILPVEHTVVADHQVALRPDGDAQCHETSHVVLEHLRGQHDTDERQRAGDRENHRNQMHDEAPERRAEFLDVARVNRVRAEQQQLQGHQERRKQNE